MANFTEEAIKNKFMELLNRKPINKITVKEIAAIRSIIILTICRRSLRLSLPMRLSVLSRCIMKRAQFMSIFLTRLTLR